MNQEKLFKRGSKPKDVQLDSDIVDEIKNSMLKYQTESEYYVYLFDNDMLNVILTLSFLNKTIMTKKIKAKIEILEKLKDFEQGWVQELKDVYFNVEIDQLNVVQQVRRASQSFNTHETLLIGVFQQFKSLQIINIIFQHDFYKNKLRVQVIVDNKLEPFNKLSFKEKDSKSVKNDLIIMKQPDGNGVFLLCFSSQKARPERISSISEQQMMRSSRKSDVSKKQERISSGEKQKSMLSNNSDKEQTGVSINQESQAKEDKYFFCFMLLILIAIVVYDYWSKI